MSRLKNFSRNLATGYLQLGVNVVYSLVSVPLILHWLPKAEFGMWALLVQLMSYIALVDMGINSAIARFLVDHKDQRGSGEYGALIRTSALVSLAQGLVVLAVVVLGAPLLASLMKIPAEYSAVFVSLMRLQGGIALITFCMNPLIIILNAHQRMDLVARQGIFNLLLGLGLLTLFLYRGCGIYAFIYAGAITALITPFQLFWHCHRLALIPRAGEWGRITWPQFKEVFLYGKDVFLMNVGAQIITTSQTIIISRTLGLEAAAAWSVGTKVFMLARQVMFQPYAAAAAALSEMLARHETGRLRARFQNLVVLTASLGAFLGTAFALCNSLFVTIWTNGKIVWSPGGDVLLAIWFFFTSLQTTHCNFVSVTKQIGGMRYLYFLEGCCFVGLALLLGQRWGLGGVIACSIACTIGFSNLYGWWRSQRYFHVSYADLILGWVRSSWKLAGTLSILGWLLWLATAGLSPIWRLAIHGLAVGSVGGFLFLCLGLPGEVIQNVGTRLPRPLARLLEMIGPVATQKLKKPGVGTC